MIDLFPHVPGVRNILVLRPNAVGDFMLALPALHALRHAYPKARIVLLGKSWHADFLRGRPGPIDEVLVMPLVPGVGAPVDAEYGEESNARFIAAVREQQFDLALQMYGGGRYSNPFINSLGARLTIGLRTPDAEGLDRCLPYGELVNRRLELLQVAALAGAPPYFMEQELTVTGHDRQEAAALIPPSQGERIVILHPGASDVRRQWPPERFAAVGDMLATKGATVVISATPAEQVLAKAIVAHMQHEVLDLKGRLSLHGLCGLLERSTMMVATDTGPLHIALALRVPTVGIFWLTNLLESGPLKQHLLRAALSVKTLCPVCGAVNRKNVRCAHDVCFVDDVSVEEVSALAAQLFDESQPRRATAAPQPAPHRSSHRPGPTRNGAKPDRAGTSASCPPY